MIPIVLTASPCSSVRAAAKEDHRVNCAKLNIAGFEFRVL
jgi:hypothetical protein